MDLFGSLKRERPSRRRRRGMFEKGLFYRKYSENNKASILNSNGIDFKTELIRFKPYIPMNYF